MTVSPNDAHPAPIYNARFRVIFPILDADGDLVAGATGLDSEVSQDSGTFADCTNEATEIATSSGMYYLDLIATELDNTSATLIVKSSGKTTPITLHPIRLPVVRTGTAQAGAGTTITLDSGASAIDDYYVGMYVNITNNSPANALGQCRLVTAYVGSTKVATVAAAWGTNPSSASTFEVLLAPGMIPVKPGVVEALTEDTYAEPGQGSPGATISLKDKLGYLYKGFRNRHTQTASEYALYADNATTKDQEAAVSDDGTTFDRSELTTGA